MASSFAVPKSGTRGILWPAIPAPPDRLILAVLSQLEQSQWYKPDELWALQSRQLALLADYARQAVPFYKDRLAGLAVEKGKGVSPQQWQSLPVLTRRDIQAAPDALVSRRYPNKHGPAQDVWTSGSTGQPVRVKTTGVTSIFLGALMLRYHAWHGRDLNGTSAAIQLVDDAKLKATDAGQHKSWVPAHGTGRALYQTIRLPVSEQLGWLAAVRPDYLVTYPSNLAALLECSRGTGIAPAGLKQVATMGEVLDPALREDCRKTWDAGLTDVYSAQEVGIIAVQCPDHPHYHVQSEGVLVEVVDEAGRPCRAGQTGRILVTDLHNFATPLIRYEIGDYGEVGASCPCGRGLPVLKRIAGRVRNMLRLPSGDQIWPLFFSREVGDAVPVVNQAQLIQTGRDSLLLKAVVERPLVAAEEERLKEAVLKRLGYRFALTVEYPKEIPRAANGKYEDFVSTL